VTQVSLALLAPQLPAAWTHTLVAKKRLINAWWARAERGRRAVDQAGQWALPGVALAPGESPAEAAARAFREQVGVDLDPEFRAAAAARDALARAEADLLHLGEGAELRARLAADALRSSELAQGAARAARSPYADAARAARAEAEKSGRRGGADRTRSIRAAAADPNRDAVRVEGLGPLGLAEDDYLVVLRVSLARLLSIRALAAINLGPAMTGAPPWRPWTALAARARGGPAPAGPPVPPRLPAGKPRDASLRDWELGELALVPREALTGHLGVFVPLPALHPDDLRLIQAKPPHTQDVTRFAAMATHLTTEHT
jgi:ADP-ribose pyrophosphatase YjhB (NUDIX family)